MNKLIFLTCTLFLGLQVDAQNIIKVRSQHSKELIHVLKDESFYGRGESKIFIQQVGVGYEFITAANNKNSNRYNLYKNGKRIGEFPYPHFSDAEYWETDSKVGEETLYTLNFKNGKKFGPYQWVSPCFSRENKLIAIRYKDKGKVYFKNLQTNKLVGPYDQIYVQSTENYNITYECIEGSQHYLFHNEEKYGPFYEVSCPYSYQKSDPFYFTFQNDKEEWQVFYKKEIPTLFTGNPAVTIFDNEKILINGETKIEGSTRKVFMLDDKSYEDYYNYKSIVCNSFGDVLVLEADRETKTESSKIFRNDVLIGSYKTTRLYSSNNKKSTIYNLILIEKSIDPDVLYESYSIVKNDKIIPIGTSNEIDVNDLHLIGEDVIYIRKSDSTLVINGKETIHKKVTHVDYSNYPEESFIVKKQGRFDVILRNEKEISAEELKKTRRYNPEWYNLKSNPYSTERVNDKTYVYAKGSNKRFGPITRGTSIVFSNDKKHYAESDDRRMEIFLDGKRISDGFNIAYDPKTNAFHWLSIDKNNMYLHTYQNN